MHPQLWEREQLALPGERLLPKFCIFVCDACSIGREGREHFTLPHICVRSARVCASSRASLPGGCGAVMLAISHS